MEPLIKELRQMSVREKGRLNKALMKQYNWGAEWGGVMTLSEFISRHRPASKHQYTQRYSSRKIHLEYKELQKPKVTYHMELPNGSIYDIPKLVFECLDVPEGPSLHD